MAEIPNALPPGWDCKYDPRTSRYYFINHYTKVTTWDDPRQKYRQIHGTPTHVPSHPVEHIPLQDLSNLRMSPAQTSRGSVNKNISNGPHHHPLVSQAVSRMQETNLTQVPADTEQSVSKISTMFPTVTETHIRMLMKKYMKSIFPQVEETVLLDVLGNNENNVQKASEALKEMGFEKREMKLPKSKKTEPKPVEPPKAAPKILSTEEKNSMKTALQAKYKEIPERVIIIALESVDYNKSRAIQILDIVKQEESSSSKTSSESSKRDENKIEESSPNALLKKSKSALITPSPSIHVLQLDSKNRRTKEKKNSTREPLQENNAPSENTYRSSYLIKSLGPNSSLVKGSDNGMLLEDYVSWDGPDPTIREGSKNGLAKGPNRSLLLQRAYQPCGPKSENRKGPALGLAKGSIYSQMKTLVVGESRGK